MKKIIGGKRYDTDTAQPMAHDSYGGPRDFEHWRETLYRKSTGEYFLYGTGGPSSHYAERVEQNTWSGGEQIIPLTVDAAKEWAEKHLDSDEYEEIFGEIDETDEKRTVTFHLTLDTVEKIKRGAAAAGISLSDYVTSLIPCIQ